jgi:hypothetical protein
MAVLENRCGLRSSKCSSMISMDTESGFRTYWTWMSKHSCGLCTATRGGSKVCTSVSTPVSCLTHTSRKLPTSPGSSTDS